MQPTMIRKQVKGLYQRVSSQLSSSTSAAQPAVPQLSGPSQVAPAASPNELYDNLSKLAMPPPAQQQPSGLTNLLQNALQSAQG